MCRGAITSSAFATHGVESLHEFVGITAFVVGAAQLLFLVKLVGSMRHGKAASGNPWGVTTLE